MSGCQYGPPVDELVVRQRPLGRALVVIHVDLEQVVALAVAAVDDPLAVRREERAAVVALGVGDPSRVLAVRVHDVDLAVAVAERREDDLRPVGRIASLGVVARRVGQAHEVLAVEVGGEDVHRLGELPAIAGRPAVGRPLGRFDVGAGIQVRRGEQDRPAVRVEVRASAPPFARADHSGRRVVFQMTEEDLIAVLVGPGPVEDRRGEVGHGLEDDGHPIGAEIALAGTGESAGDLADVPEVPRLEAGDLLGRQARARAGGPAGC